MTVSSSVNGREIVFFATEVALKQGQNEIWTKCNVTAPGGYVFEKATLTWHSLNFAQEFVEGGKKQVLSLFPHGKALHVDAEMVDESTSLILCD